MRDYAHASVESRKSSIRNHENNSKDFIDFKVNRNQAVCHKMFV